MAEETNTQTQQTEGGGFFSVCRFLFGGNVIKYLDTKGAKDVGQ